MIRRLIAPVVLVAGVATMAMATGWAPAQPELLPSGGACQFAPCGTLEDPPRWRAAWWVWGAGLLALVGAVAFLAPPVRRVPAWQVIACVVAGAAGLVKARGVAITPRR